MKYEVGKVFYLVGDENLKVIPFRIVEEVTRTTLEGVEKSYIVELPDNKKTRAKMSQLKGSIFEDLNSLKVHMIENAKKAIEEITFNALSIAENVFNINAIEEIANNVIKNEELEEENINNNVQNESNEDIIKVDIGNGVIANMKVTDLEKVN